MTTLEYPSPLPVDREIAHDLAGEVERTIDAAIATQHRCLQRGILDHILGEIGTANHPSGDLDQLATMGDEGLEQGLRGKALTDDHCLALSTDSDARMISRAT